MILKSLKIATLVSLSLGFAACNPLASGDEGAGVASSEPVAAQEAALENGSALLIEVDPEGREPLKKDRNCRK